jgi:predicted dehydrogenase
LTSTGFRSKFVLVRSGPAGALGDIGTHAENLVSTVTGLRIESLCADLASLVEGRALDDDASLLLRFHGGARGVLTASQVMTGSENDLAIHVAGSEGALQWRQEDPNRLLHFRADAPLAVLTRGSPWLCDAARRATRLPTGHPEAFIEAFANVYRGVAEHIRAIGSGRPPADGEADYPRLADGARGVRFIERTIASARGTEKWTAFD